MSNKQSKINGSMSDRGGHHGLNAKEIAHYDQAFRAIDKKKTGTIPTKSLRTILESMGHSISSSEFYMITADADVESSGTLDFQEYMSCCATWKQNNCRQGARITAETFDALAMDGDVSPEIVKRALDAFDLGFNVDKVMDERGIKVEDGKVGLTGKQFSELMK